MLALKLASLLLLAASLWPWPPWPRNLLDMAVLSCCALWLDSRAFRLPTGLYRPSLPFYLGLGWLGFTPLAVGLSLFSTTWLPGRRHEQAAIWQGLVYLGVGLLALRHLPSSLLSLAIVATVGSCWGSWRASQLPKNLQGRRLYRALLAFEIALPWCLLLLTGGPAASLVAAALLWLLGEGAVNACHRVYALQASQAIEDKQQSDQALSEVRQQLSEQQVHLALEARQRQMIERLARQLAEGPDFNSTQRAILDTLTRLLAARSVVLFLWNSTTSRLEPSCWVSPDSERLAQSLGSGFREPLVAFCWDQGRLLSRQADPILNSEIFPLEDQAMASPLPEVGVIYVGRQSHPWNPQDRQLLEWVSEKAVLGLQASWRHHQQNQMQMEQSTLNIQLREHVQLLEHLVQGAGWLSSQLSVRGALEALESEIRQLLDHDLGAVYLGPPGQLQRVHHWTNSADSTHRLQSEVANQMASACVEKHKPILYADLGGPPESLHSLMCVPLQFPASEAEQAGALLVATQPANAYQHPQLHLLSLLSIQLGVTLRNAKLYEEIQQAKTRLEESQAQLIQSSKLTAIGQLAAGVAHELNTPLGAVSLSLDLLSLDYPDGNTRIENGFQAIERARNIIDKLLVYSRRTHDAEHEEVDLHDVVVQACDLAQARLRQEKVIMDIQQQTAARVRAKSVELQQVVVNLVLNAADAYGGISGEKRLVLRSGRSEGKAWISIQDFAGGIPEHIQSQVFDPFFTTKPIGKGTGLGLAISQEICQLYGGSLTFESRQGDGTTFIMSFPALA